MIFRRMEEKNSFRLNFQNINYRKFLLILSLFFVVVFSLILTVVVGRIVNLNQAPTDTLACSRYCSAGSCRCTSGPKNGQTLDFGEDQNTPHSSCSARLNDACTNFCGAGNSFSGSGSNQLICPGGGAPSGSQPPPGSQPSSSNSCSGSGNARACTTVGQVVPISDGTCRCERTTGTLCACVKTGGSVCGDGKGYVGDPCVGDVTGRGKCSGTLQPSGANACRCATDPNTCTSSGDPIDVLPTGKECTSDIQCGAGSFCRNDVCIKKYGNGIECTRNAQCLSNNCVNGKCQSAGTGPSGSVVNECTDDASAGSGFYCENAKKRPLLAEGKQCTRNSQCNTGLCSSYVCRTVSGAGSCENGTIPNGHWKCELVNGQRNGFGVLCSNGVLQSQRVKADACAPNVSGKLCKDLTRLSAGEASKGAFVGCNGALNCFCPYSSGSPGSLFTSNDQNIAPICVQDPGNDSCGAGSLEQQTQGNQQQQQQPPPSSQPTPYCGDALCNASGELCERVSPGSTTYRACNGVTNSAPSGSVVSSCYGVNFNQPVTSTTCKYCGDGVYTPGNEQCDPSAPAGNGNNPSNCNPNCTLVGQACIDLVENGSDPITSGVGNIIEYVFVYQNASTVNPYPNIRLAVNTFSSPLGRDANNPTQSLVAPSTTPTFNSLNNRWTYRFLWEAASPSGTPVANGTYNVRVFLDGTSATETTSPSACTENITVNSSTPQNPIFTIVKQSSHTCNQTTGDAIINYTVTVTNVGPVSGVIDFVQDEIDSNVRALGISPTNIIPAYGVYNQTTGIINWTGSVADRTYSAGQSRNFTYQIVIPAANLLSFFNLGVYNQVTVQYDTNTTNDNTSSFDLRTFLNCTVNSIPVTNLPGGMQTALLGCLVMMLGLLVFVTERGRRISESFYLYTFSPISDFIKDWTIPGYREQRIVDEKFEEKLREKIK